MQFDFLKLLFLINQILYIKKRLLLIFIEILLSEIFYKYGLTKIKVKY